MKVFKTFYSVKEQVLVKENKANIQLNISHNTTKDKHNCNFDI